MDMFEEQDIYREYPKEKKPSGKKIALIIIAAVLVLALVAGGAFFGGTLYAGSQSIESDMPMVKAVIDAFCARTGKALIYVSHYDTDLPSCIDHRLELLRH